MISKEKEAINFGRSEEGRGEIKRKEHGGGWRKDREWGCDVITLQQKLKKDAFICFPEFTESSKPPWWQLS